MIVTTASAKNPNSMYEVGAAVEYSCNAGSLLIGPATRTCLDTGFYNEFPPVCKSKYTKYREILWFRFRWIIVNIHDIPSLFLDIECGYPANIKHGEYTLINNTVGYLSQVLYSCEEGYEMTGKLMIY